MPEPDSRATSLASVLQLLAKGDGLATQRIRIGPAITAARPSWPFPAEVLPDGWPQPDWPAQALRAPDNGRKTPPVALVAMFGLDETETAEAVRQLASRLRHGDDIVPIILTDQPAQGLFRRQGLLVEYFPPGLSGSVAADEWFRRRLELLWQKWGARTLIDLSRADCFGARAAGLPLLEQWPWRDPAEKEWIRLAPTPVRPPTPDIAALRAEAAATGLLETPDSFVVYRIIGNDLFPRHQPGQSLQNVRFILEHEPRHEGLERRWVLNRIMDRREEAELLHLLEASGEAVLQIPFDLSEYAACDWDLEPFALENFLLWQHPAGMSERRYLRAQTRARRHKTNYAMNNNGARNAALRDGRSRARWVLPWDGNCFLTTGAWAELRQMIGQNRHLKYFLVPMQRLTETDPLFDPDYRPEAAEEPQVVFRCDAAEEFDTSYYYGRRPKVELFWRLGFAGNWDLSNDDRWDLPRPQPSREAGQFMVASWVARLPSGMAELELPSRSGQVGREEARNQAIVATLDALDRDVLSGRFVSQNLAFYDQARLDELKRAELGSETGELRARLLTEAKAALDRGPYTVVDKQSLPPSGDAHDYWHPAPYWWPNPYTLDGLPYVRRDGERVPGTELYGPMSERYDRTRLQRLFDDTTILALAWAASGERRFAEHAAALVRCWFVDPATRMAPHLTFAQLRLGHDAGEIQGSGVIEFKDLYFFLDAVRLLRRTGTLADTDDAAFRTWLTQYLGWLDTSPQGLAERGAHNNHGTCYDLQTAAIAAYLDDVPRLIEIFRTSRERLLRQFDDQGAPLQELARTKPLHYVAFTLQSWVNLAIVAGRCGDRLCAFGSDCGRGLTEALEWGLRYLAEHAAGSDYEAKRSIPLRTALWELRGEALPLALQHPLFHPDDGVAPFWMLGQPLTAPVSGRSSSFPQLVRTNLPPAAALAR